MAVACSAIPPLQAVAPVFAAVSFATGVLDTYKSCSEGDAIDCGVGIAGVIPVAGSAFKTGKGIYKAGKKAEQAVDKLNDFNAAKYGKYGTGAERRGLGRDVSRAGQEHARQKRNALPWGKNGGRFLDDGSGLSRWGGNIALAENVGWETCKRWFSCASRHQTYGQKPWWHKNFGAGGRKPKAISSSYSAYLFRKQMEQF